jgi:hypothetical protein
MPGAIVTYAPRIHQLGTIASTGRQLFTHCASLTATSSFETEQPKGRERPNEGIAGLPIQIGDFAILAVP